MAQSLYQEGLNSYDFRWEQNFKKIVMTSWLWWKVFINQFKIHDV